MPLGTLAGRVVVVTGAGSGIGQAGALAIAAAGATVLCADIDDDAAAATSDRAGDRADAAYLDVTDRDAVFRLIRDVREQHGRLDVVANIAGAVTSRGPVDTLTDEELDRGIALNLKSLVYGCQAAAKAMERGGSIINVGSGTVDAAVADLAAVTGVLANITSKAGIAALERATADVDVYALVNVVGGVTPADIGHFLELTPDQWQHGLDLNLGYAVRTCQIAARRMIAGGHGGSLVNLSVADARSAMPWFSVYGAARSALESATRTMAVELGPVGVRANSVAWGLIDSPRAHSGAGSNGRAERDLIPLGRRGTVGEVASMVLFLLSDLGGYVTGQTIAVDGGLALRTAHYGPLRNIPEFLEDRPTRQALRKAFDRISGRPGSGLSQ